ncbi:MAG: SDR family NAD(P)-dependent oxidoreductase, partial [Candidatus Thermoplasmatota archaeon]|nr:SDR family NAD(P)-dependent oxidoreductase [Candidatus Thermoplasmatota archaeon]
MFDLNNKVAIVTGASGGLGEAIAEALSKHGARLAILDNKDGGRIVEKLETESKYY